MNTLSEDVNNLHLSERAFQHQLAQPKNDYIEFRKEEIEQSIPDRFETQVLKYPDRVAVRTDERELTYDTFNRLANRIAWAILDQRGEGEEAVILLFKQGVLPIAAIFGALKAGKIYVPLQTSYPRSRIAYMLEDSQAKVILTDKASFPLAGELAGDGIHLINVEEMDPQLSDENPGLPISPNNIAYIIYTSGSTGQPKGVFNSHRNLLYHVMRYTNDVHICVDDRHSLLRAYSFNGALKDIYGSLLNGASLYPFDLKEEGMVELTKWLIRSEITLCCFVATAFRHFVNSLTGKEAFPRLRSILVGAESVYRRDVELYKKYFSPNCVFLTGFGTSETGSARRYFINKESRLGDGKIPMGYPLQDMEILILDEDGKPAESEEVGEIAVKSRYIALGYWRKPELTQARFLPDPDGGEERIYLTGDLGRMLPDGCLMHTGREDFQVKIRGHRIETDEIEAALLDLDSIKEASVQAQPDRHGNQRLVAYIVPAGERVPTVTELRRFLSETLPDYMIPAIFMTLEALPLTPDSKVNRRALPMPDTARPELENPYVAPRTPVEQRLAGIWAEVLGVDQVGINDNFLELGGNSLLATQIVSRVLEAFQVEVAQRSLFQSPTVTEMAVVIDQSRVEKTEDEDISQILEELESLPDEEVKRLLTDEEASE